MYILYCSTHKKIHRLCRQLKWGHNVKLILYFKFRRGERFSYITEYFYVNEYNNIVHEPTTRSKSVVATYSSSLNCLFLLRLLARLFDSSSHACWTSKNRFCTSSLVASSLALSGWYLTASVRHWFLISACVAPDLNSNTLNTERNFERFVERNTTIVIFFLKKSRPWTVAVTGGWTGRDRIVLLLHVWKQRYNIAENTNDSEQSWTIKFQYIFKTTINIKKNCDGIKNIWSSFKKVK